VPQRPTVAELLRASCHARRPPGSQVCNVL
jgi:hypothetical protein